MTFKLQLDFVHWNPLPGVTEKPSGKAVKLQDAQYPDLPLSQLFRPLCASRLSSYGAPLDLRRYEVVTRE